MQTQLAAGNELDLNVYLHSSVILLSCVSEAQPIILYTNMLFIGEVCKNIHIISIIISTD